MITNIQKEDLCQVFCMYFPEERWTNIFKSGNDSGYKVSIFCGQILSPTQAPSLGLLQAQGFDVKVT